MIIKVNVNSEIKVNSLVDLHKLKVINVDNQESYEWPIQIGQHQLM